MWRIALWILLILFLLLVAAAVFFFLYAHRRRREARPDPAKLDGVWRQQHDLIQEGNAWIDANGYEDVSIQSFDGLTLRGIFIPAEHSRACMLLFHGYRSIGRYDFPVLAPFYHQQQLSVLIVDQRACGKSEGTYITFGVKERQDVQGWCQYMTGRLPGVPLVIEGLSLGAATVMMAAGLPLPDSVRGIIADCGFTSPWDIIAHCARTWYHLPPFPLVYMVALLSRIFAGFDYRACSTLETLSHSTLPILLIHGGKDTFVPTNMTRQNYAAAKGRKRMHIVPEAGHALSYLLDTSGCQKILLDFLDMILEGNADGQ